MSINRTVLREQVKEHLLSQILSGGYKSGDRLVETQIAQELGTSQAPVREALRELESMRFVESQPFRGTRVRKITDEELAEIYPVRAALEELAGRLAANRLENNIERISIEFDAMMAAAHSGDLHEQIHHDVEFHRLIVEAAGNKTLLDVWMSLRIEARTLVTALATHIDPLELAEMHRPVLAALKSGDQEATASALHRHLQVFADLLLKGKNV